MHHKEFIEAAKRGSIDAVFAYLDDGGEVDALSDAGMTALSWAVCRGREQVVDKLISVNANVNLVDSNGAIPLNYAQTQGMIEKLLPLTKPVLVEQWKKDVLSGYEKAKESPYTTEEHLLAYRKHFGKYVDGL